MRKVLVGMVALAATVAGVSACETKNKAKGEALDARASGVLVQKSADVTSAGSHALAMPAETSGSLETTPKPRFTLVLGEGKGGFKFRSVMLSDETKAMIDQMFTGEADAGDLGNSHINIEGYTDNLGSKTINDQVGRARAEAVKAYLVEQYGIPEDRIGVVSYGMEKPVADNSTPEGRAKNRRVVIKVVD